MLAGVAACCVSSIDWQAECQPLPIGYRTGHQYQCALEALSCMQVAGERMPEHQKQNSYLGYKKVH